MPWAKIIPSKTVIPLYDSPPTRPIGQPTLQASKGKLTKSLKLTNQPYSVQRQAKHLMRQLYMRTSQGNVPQVTLPSHCRLNLTAIRNQQLDLLHHPRYVHASLAYTRDLKSGIHFLELDLTFSRSGLPRPTRRSRPGSRCQTHPCPQSLRAHFIAGCDQSGHGCVWNHWPADKGFSTESENQPPPNGEKYGDPSQTLNKAIRCPKYIIFTLEENINKLHGTNRCQIGKTCPCP